MTGHVVLTAQTEQTLEILVQDTLQLTAERIDYLVILQTSALADPYAIPLDDEEQQYTDPLSRETLISLARQYEGIVRSSDIPQDFSIQFNFSNQGQELIFIQFLSVKNLEKFYREIEFYPNLSATTLNATRDITMEMEDRLLTKIIKKAEREAQNLAAAIGRKAGAILQVAEISPGTDDNIDTHVSNNVGGWTAYPALGRMPFSPDNGGIARSSLITLSKAYRFTFALK
ncbi:MAG: hypothetical protein KDD15_26885 [Lewinella sp.]|nr:hypothetical protein [Lewinella sp.]